MLSLTNYLTGTVISPEIKVTNFSKDVKTSTELAIT
jgi:hypothetical protein